MTTVELDILHSEIESLRIARANIAKWKEVEAAMVERIKETMGNAEVGTIGGHVVVTWKTSSPAIVLDEKRLREQLPADVLAPFLREKNAARPFKVME